MFSFPDILSNPPVSLFSKGGYIEMKKWNYNIDEAQGVKIMSPEFEKVLDTRVSNLEDRMVNIETDIKEIKA